MTTPRKAERPQSRADLLGSVAAITQPVARRGRPPKIALPKGHIPPNIPVPHPGAGAMPIEAEARPPIREPPRMELLTCKQVAAMLAVTEATVWVNVKNGRLPRPVYVAGKTPRWIMSELEAALLATRDPAAMEAAAA